MKIHTAYSKTHWHRHRARTSTRWHLAFGAMLS